jgi:hypothetical protein
VRVRVRVRVRVGVRERVGVKKTGEGYYEPMNLKGKG